MSTLGIEQHAMKELIRVDDCDVPHVLPWASGLRIPAIERFDRSDQSNLGDLTRDERGVSRLRVDVLPFEIQMKV
jgi:hypothetical protein